MTSREELKNIRIDEKSLLILFELSGADPEWVANMTAEEKREMIDKANRIIEEHYRI